ncbi:MAG: hypothetical protein A3K83_00795 [Omnitrophica WOR_2 bacterium RBG_13_44_8b]|nr:MAG: hypothetical protein A3K83_00795 [Omnitrophica WOR_2 bacterium RBG_13_44_8b]
MEYRINKQGLLDRISAWDGFLKRRVHLIACGGTALTLLGVKASTKDIDLMVPDLDEYEYLISILKQLGYKPATGWGWARGDGFIFDLFRGKSIHTTELLESPLDKGNNILFKEFNRVYLGILNYYDIIISKLFRATAIDTEDCLILIKSKKKAIDIKHLEARFKETASFDVSQDKVNKNFAHFLKILQKRSLINEKR